MKTFRSPVLLALTALSCSLSSPALAANGHVTQRGPSQLLLDTRGAIDPAETFPTVTGAMRLQINEKGEVRKQTLQIVAAGLETNAPISLTAAIGSDSDVTVVLASETDARGRVGLLFQSKDPAAHRLARGHQSLPDVLSPLTQVRAICIENAGMQVVGFSWVVNASAYRYIVRRNLTPSEVGGTAEGSIKLVANQRKVNFTLLAGGLTPETNYALALNGTSVLDATSDANGQLRLRGWPTNVAVLEVRSLGLVDSGGATILSTTLPE